jgi:SPP1 family predicted phage head-tail adaptor
MIGKKVTLELRRETTTSDGMGGWTTTVECKRYIKGVLSTIRGDERLSADKLTVISSHYFYIDFPIGLTVTAEDIFRYGTRKFKIIFPADIGANQEKRLRITLLEEV